MVLPDLLGPKELLDPQALLGRMVSTAQLGLQEVLALPALPDQREVLALLVPRGRLVPRGLPDLQVPLGRRVLLAQQDPLEPTVQQGRLDPLGLLEPQVLQVPREPREILAPRDLLDLPARPGLQEQADLRDLRAVRQQ